MQRSRRPIAAVPWRPGRQEARALCQQLFVLDDPDKLITLGILYRGLKRLGFNTGLSETPITPVIVGDAELADAFSRQLLAAGVFAQESAILRRPWGRLAFAPSSRRPTPRRSWSRALQIMESVARKLGII